MKINGMQGMLGAFLTAAIVTGLTIVAPPATAQNSPRHYSDDAIVRDLKAGKLTVREAQMLRERRDHATAPAAPEPRPHAVKPPPHPLPHKAHQPRKVGKEVHHGQPAVAKKAAKAPVHQLTKPHAHKNGKPKAHAKTPHNEHAKAEHGKSVRHAKPVKPVRSTRAHVVRASSGDGVPVRHQAVKYIR